MPVIRVERIRYVTFMVQEVMNFCETFMKNTMSLSDMVEILEVDVTGSSEVKI
jgi:hypothetical protein